MVSFDTIFSILDSFVSQNTRTRPRSFQDAIPALNYLFELSISLIYASCVVYYSLSKRRFAFWHPKMRNVCLVALVSYISILIPVVFFVLDISLPRLAGWGEYIRWVGAAAASVVVWEWVERIEALERDERKDGILGREIFDGDEMLDVTPSEDAGWNRGFGRNAGDRDVEKGTAFNFKSTLATARATLPLKRRKKRPAEQNPSVDAAATAATKTRTTGQNLITVPQTTGTPPSRSDTTSASTVYAIRYHNLTSPSPGVPEGVQDPNTPASETDVPKEVTDSSTESSPSMANKEATQAKRGDRLPNQSAAETISFWQSVANPFKRRRAEPPAEVAGAQVASGMRRSPIDRAMNLKDRIGAFASAQKDRFGGRNASIHAAQLPVTVIPAPRGNEKTWSPANARHALGGSGAVQDPVSATAADESRCEEQSSVAGENVIVIPAPTEGRAWSPPDAYDPAKSHSSNSRRSTDTPGPQRATPPARTSTSSARNVHTPPTLQLTPPAPTQAKVTLRRSTFTRPGSISPISETLGVVPRPSLTGPSLMKPTSLDRSTAAAAPTTGQDSTAAGHDDQAKVLRERPIPPEQVSTPAAQDGALAASSSDSQDEQLQEPVEARQGFRPADAPAPTVSGERNRGDG